ncbi:hypothetical protein WOLCODRAFT_149681 [Wolfiporia cocos MD-104 SS10]|uniref:Uncharacterized protein n=1 Tax=Wolfiporia cocos (strain MD-104) TaxID=742152 RepID=A0A2H3J9Z8_WOLCO|nr:hypothetical protein WOLCODRAFT_149681 [Wolfiporia cocos MD-104 SS10]
MAQEMRHALQIAERTYTQYEESHVRLWYPHVTLSWLGVPPGPFVSDDADTTIQLHITETHEVEYGGKLPGGLTYAMLSSSKEHDPRKGESRWRSPSIVIMEAWSLPWMLRARIHMAKNLAAQPPGVHVSRLRRVILLDIYSAAMGLIVSGLRKCLMKRKTAKVNAVKRRSPEVATAPIREDGQDYVDTVDAKKQQGVDTKFEVIRPQR